MPEIVDLDALAAARAEKRVGEPPKVKLGGVVYELPIELPLDFAIWIGNTATGDMSHIDDMLRTLFGDHFAVVRPQLRLDDLKELMANIQKLYGAGSGELVPSAQS